MRSVLEIGGRRVPLLRWSVLRMALGAKNLTRNWQVGDGREEALAAYVVAHARQGDPEDAIRVIDEISASTSRGGRIASETGSEASSGNPNRNRCAGASVLLRSWFS